MHVKSSPAAIMMQRPIRTGGHAASASSGLRKAILANQTSAKKLKVGQAVGSFVPKLAQKAFEKYGFSTVALHTDWPAIVGGELARFTKPERLKWPRPVPIRGDVEAGCEGRPGATLVLSVAPERALDVQYGATQIVERINSYFGYRAVAEVRVVQGPLTANAHGRELRPEGRTDIEASRTGAVHEFGECDELLAAIKDEKLRTSLTRLQAGILSARR
jgi:hypothetical protein